MTKREHERLIRERRIRKRKQERRRRIAKLIIRNMIIYLSFIILLFIVVKVYIIVKTYEGSKNKEKNDSKMEQTLLMNLDDKEEALTDKEEVRTDYDEELILRLKNMEGENPEISNMLVQMDAYPEALLELLVKNPETLEFVKNYPKQKIPFKLSGKIAISDCDQTNGIPFFMQWDERWGYYNYGNKMMALSGCGPTCLSMVAVGLTGDSTLNPGVVAQFSEENGFIDDNNGTSWSLMTMGAQELGLSSREIPLEESVIIQEVLSGNPVICSMRPGDFTTEGHFIVLCGFEDGKFTINDPNSRTNSNKSWSFFDLQFQIKNLWAFSVFEAGVEGIETPLTFLETAALQGKTCRTENP